MPKQSDAKTAWGLSPQNIALAIIALSVLFIGAWSALTMINSGPKLSLAGKKYQVEVMRTSAELRQGLSGRNSLARNEAMLFDFGGPGKHCIWMKDMQFTIDVVWLDEQKIVAHLQEKVSPQTFPKNFCSSQPTYYVVELPEGEIERRGVVIGTPASF